MASNPKISPWRSTPATKRRRKPINLSLSTDALALLDELAAEEERARSQVIEDALNAYKTSRSKLSSD